MRMDVIIGMLMASFAVYLAFRVNFRIRYDWNWEAIPQYLFRYDATARRWIPNILIQGLFTTLKLSLWATLFATLIGGIMGLFRVSGSFFKRMAGATYVQSIRNLPPLVLIFIFYYFASDQILPALGIPNLINDTEGNSLRIFSFFFAPPSLLAPFLSGMIALAVFEGSYITEIVRAGIQSIDHGQWEASCALGLNRWQQLRHVIFPQAVSRILPPLAGQFISTIKDSAIVSVVSIQELTFQGLELMAATYMTFEIWITITGMYLMMTLSCSLALSKIERRISIHTA
ncbi:MAG: amino acid ABC transporter permease [Desulfobacterales bacterium CG23_combo_of_CG06-09_8_20_14_all_52_9]|nr:MAG: amino acid ABC transporter permease [Desulfobacterales bacterium CG23_combo_of_CG06-09_8_20_14_all_52_9]